MSKSLRKKINDIVIPADINIKRLANGKLRDHVCLLYKVYNTVMFINDASDVKLFSLQTR